jgi:ribosomal protein L30E
MEEKNMDLSRQLKNAIATGNLRFGQRQALDACARGASMVNRELGIACGKPFSVSTISIIDAGDSDLLTLETNLE